MKTKNIKKQTSLIWEISENALHYAFINQVEKEVYSSKDGEFWLQVFEITKMISGIFFAEDREDYFDFSDETNGMQDFYLDCYKMIREDNGCPFIVYRLAFGCFLGSCKGKEGLNNLLIALSVD